jgi:hypothetical protein
MEGNRGGSLRVDVEPGGVRVGGVLHALDLPAAVAPAVAGLWEGRAGPDYTSAIAARSANVLNRLGAAQLRRRHDRTHACAFGHAALVVSHSSSSSA